MKGGDDGRVEPVLAEQLERMFRTVAFYHRVGLEELALVEPAAARAASKDEFLRPHVRTLRALVRLALRHAPAEVGRLVEEYPDVGQLLRRLGEPVAEDPGAGGAPDDASR